MLSEEKANALISQIKQLVEPVRETYPLFGRIWATCNAAEQNYAGADKVLEAEMIVNISIIKSQNKALGLKG
jgi:hypothetical protein